ncbi:amidase [Amycolatopsis sp. BJA-103]|uniref:amidase n=1 Tax=Amycolatopsis sp. BJA-103 TaxID=1911175 RepID=UPI000C765248|nr:amidase [Amycolatopsis sp. BJA-103]AUI64041.1 amidase [Amycolatopsis sp. BJA-103]PNE16072.1 amidase [Amycolatopsis sp. BJA-103]
MRSSARTRRRGIVAALTGACLLLPAAAHADDRPASLQAAEMSTALDRLTIPDLQRAMDGRLLSSERLTRGYLDRVNALNPRLNAVVQTNPDALALARQSDSRRRAHQARGPLEGIPILLKENIDTADRQTTTAGSTALRTAKPAKDAFLVQRLRDAGAVILGKANMSEWANFYGSRQIPGWSAVGGQTRNPYVLDRSPCGSSSGSAAAAAAGLATVTIGTETDSSIVCPSAATSTVGMKTTLGVVSRGGVVPITNQHDTPGPIARTVTDAALTLAVMAGADAADPATAPVAGAVPADYRTMLDRDSLRGKRIGVWRKGHEGIDRDVDRVFESTVQRLRALGATVVEGADVPDVIGMVQPHLLPAVLTEFKHDLNGYLAATPGGHPKNLTDLIAYNKKNAAIELPGFDQDLLEMADETDGNLNDPTYRAHRAAATGQARDSIDAVVKKYRLDAIVTATDLPAPPIFGGGGSPFVSSTRSTSAAGYPHITVPGGFARTGLPIGISFLGTRMTDASLLGYAYAYEQATHARKAPHYLPTAR